MHCYRLLSQGAFLGPWSAQTLESGLSIVILNRKSGLQSLGRPGSQKCLLCYAFSSITAVKKGYHNSTPGALLLQIVPFSLIIMYQNSTPRLPTYGQASSEPRGTISVPYIF